MLRGPDRFAHPAAASDQFGIQRGHRPIGRDPLDVEVESTATDAAPSTFRPSTCVSPSRRHASATIGLIASTCCRTSILLAVASFEQEFAFEQQCGPVQTVDLLVNLAEQPDHPVVPEAGLPSSSLQARARTPATMPCASETRSARARSASTG